jgi:hypothetical protein
MTNTFETKKRKLVHPWWAHLPALAALAFFLVSLFATLPLPGWAPVHFGFDGEPDRYGNPWGFVAIVIVLSVFFIVLSGFLDEQWARQEKKKSFNWLCWLDDITVGWLSATGAGYLLFLRDGGYNFTLPWGLIGAVTGGAVILSLILETLRPYRPYAGKVTESKPEILEQDLARQIKDSASFIYWESQNPVYVTIISVLLPLVFLGSSLMVWFTSGWELFAAIYFTFSTLISIGVISLVYGGQRTIATRDDIFIRWGLAGIKVLKLKTAEVDSVELQEFSPLKDFGGYGIRFNREMQAYYLRGSRGVKITMHNGKKYLIGSDRAERLLAVLKLLTGRP